MAANRKVKQTEFVRLWETVADLAEFCRRTGLSNAAAHQRAYYYRSKGIKLRDLRTAPRVDVAKMNKIIDQIRKGKHQ